MGQQELYIEKYNGESIMDVFITVGLPGCGKSSFAIFLKKIMNFFSKDLTATIIERDEIRNELFELFEHGSDHVYEYYNSSGISEREKKVTEKYKKRFYEAHENGVNIIILSDTYMNCKHLKMLINISNNLGRKVWLYDFTDVPLEVVLERNKSRSNKTKIVDENVIQHMAKKIKNIKECISRLEKEEEIYCHIVMEKKK